MTMGIYRSPELDTVPWTQKHTGNFTSENVLEPFFESEARVGDGEMAQQLRALATLSKALGSIPSTHRTAHSFL